MSLRVLLIDDHTLFREGLTTLLTRRDIQVVAAVGEGQQGIDMARQVDVDVVLLDLRMPDVDGHSVLKQLRAIDPTMAIVMLTTSADQRDLVDALRAGARGYLLKDMEPDALVEALRDIERGRTVVAPKLTQALAEAIQDPLPTQPSDPFGELTPREREILGLLAEGQSNKVIARNLGISDGTVKLHVKAILRKLQVHSRVEAAVMAVEQGLRA